MASGDKILGHMWKEMCVGLKIDEDRVHHTATTINNNQSGKMLGSLLFVCRR